MKRHTLATFVLTVLVLPACYTNPVTGRKSVVLLSQGEEAALGQQSFSDIRQKEKVSREPGLNARVNRVGQRIAQAVEQEMPSAKWEFVVFDSPDLNAFALPGGKVGVYTGLMQLAENDAELATVMAHEIGHVIARHGAERMSEALLISGLGDVAGQVVESKTGAQDRQLFDLAYGGVATVGRVLPHSRANESEADRMGAVYAARAGYDPRAAITFWQKMVAQKKSAENAGAKDDIEITFHPAGHVAGAAAVEIQHKQRRIFFTGDVLFESQRTIAGAKFPAGHFDTVIIETTRGATERPVGKERGNEVARLITSINETIQRGGSYLIPVFALGRMQEMMSVFQDARKFGRLVECPIYASGLGVDLADYFDEICRKTKHVQFSRSILKDLKVKPLPRKMNAGEDPQQNALYVISSGMMVERTPSYTLASGLLGHPRNTIGFVGYCDPDTPGGQLLATPPGGDFLFETANVRTRVKAQVERFELSGHADREELLEFAVQTGARHIVLTHGDPPARAWFAQQLAQLAPKSKVLDPVPLQTYQL